MVGVVQPLAADLVSGFLFEVGSAPTVPLPSVYADSPDLPPCHGSCLQPFL